MGNWRTWIQSNTPGSLQGYWGTRLMGMLTLFAESAAQGAGEALRAPWIREETSPDDGLRLTGSEMSIPRYPDETAAQYRARLENGWEAWAVAGDESSIEGQLAAAGFVGAYVTTDTTRQGPRGEAAPYWSQFWVRFPVGSGVVVTVQQNLWDGSATWDGSIAWQPTSLTRAQLATMIGIINQWKPSDWICRGLIFELSSGLWDGSLDWDGSAQWGGTFELTL